MFPASSMCAGHDWGNRRPRWCPAGRRRADPRGGLEPRLLRTERNEPKPDREIRRSISRMAAGAYRSGKTQWYWKNPRGPYIRFQFRMPSSGYRKGGSAMSHRFEPHYRADNTAGSASAQRTPFTSENRNVFHHRPIRRYMIAANEDPAPQRLARCRAIHPGHSVFKTVVRLLR